MTRLKDLIAEVNSELANISRSSLVRKNVLIDAPDDHYDETPAHVYRTIQDNLEAMDRRPRYRAQEILKVNHGADVVKAVSSFLGLDVDVKDVYDEYGKQTFPWEETVPEVK